jgi:Tol biopolymer transport system component
LWPSIAVSLLVALASMAVVHFHETPPAVPQLMRFQITTPDQVIPLRGAVLAPDGHSMVFPAVGADGVRRLWVRSLDAIDARPLPGADAIAGTRPFWSPDSRFVAFQAARKLKKIDVAGGAAQTLCDVPLNVLSGSWNRDGVIIFGNDVGGVMRVSDAGGIAVPVTAVAQSPKVWDGFPAFLPDGRHFVYQHGDGVSGQAGNPQPRGIYLGSLDLKPGEQNQTPLVADAYVPLYARSRDGQSGYLVFLRDATLFAQSFDDRRLQLAGDAVPIAEQVGLFNGDAMFSVSDTGALVYRAGGIARPARLTWFDREGKALDSAGEPVDAVSLALSPDGTRLAIQDRSLQRNILLLDLSRGVSTRLTFEAGGAPQWSPDGTRVAYASGGDIYQKASNGTGAPQQLLQSQQETIALTDWSRDGRLLLYTSGKYSSGAASLSADVWALPLEGDRKPVPVLRTNFTELQARLSSDLHWLAYTSNESGTLEVYVRSFSAPSTSPSTTSEGKWQISKGGGTEPRWRYDGKELFYLGANGSVMAVDIMTAPAFQPGNPKPLFQVPAGATIWDVASDGQRFLLPVLTAESSRVPFTLVLNWMAGLRK